jgi:uncharacterized membrane protein YqjE
MRETEEPALLGVMKELCDALVTLVTGHLRLARAELGDDARRLARRAALLGLAATIALLGYALACVGAALALAPRLGAPLAFLVVGGVHLLGAAAALGVLLGHAPARPLDRSLAALDRTVAALSLGDSAASAASAPVEERLAVEAIAP